jgi:hypothetical protein
MSQTDCESRSSPGWLVRLLLGCRAGDLIHCENQEYTGVQHDGGYTEAMIAKASGLVIVPDAFDSVAAPPVRGADHVRSLTGGTETHDVRWEAVKSPKELPSRRRDRTARLRRKQPLPVDSAR